MQRAPATAPFVFAVAAPVRRQLCRAGGRRCRCPERVQSRTMRAPSQAAMDMTQNDRRLLEVDIPAQPEVLVKLSLLLAEDDVDLHAVSLLIASDMALAAAVLKAVNSAHVRAARPGPERAAGDHLPRHPRGRVGDLRDGPARRLPGGARARAGLGARRRARPADGPHRPGARRRPLGGALGRPVRGMRQGGHVPPRHRALPADAGRGQGRRGTAAARAHPIRRQPRHARRGAVRELGPGAAGGRQRSLSRHRQQHARAADARPAPRRSARSRPWPTP